MLNIPGYKISEELYNGSRTLVYRGYREIDSLKVVMKLLKNSYPSFSELLLFRNQYIITKNLNSPLIVQAYSLETYQNGYVLVMEDFGGISLKQWGLQQTQQSLQQFLILAIALCDILDVLYHEGIIHKDIKPSNILINPDTKQVKLIDFSIASLLPRETQTLVNPKVLEGTLAYISPEQTGRMNRGIDYRTDFYSLGVTFYELLTGELPFLSTDPMTMVHSHIAKTPQQLGNREEIPPVISDIVMKLLAKNAEDRYQSALGLKHDLEYCLEQLQATGKITSFEIASRDVCDRFIIPDKLYGREAEVSTLLQAFERVSQGATEMMLVAGFSGIGKTAVINEVHKPIVRQRGYFIKGKYDQFQRNIPFSAFVQAFRDLMGQLLTESDAQIHQWKSKILDAVGENGQVIIDVIPELESIIGKQPPAVALSGTAAENRFNLLFQTFTQVFTTREHPLVIFLDDLQWADSASLKLMQLLMADTKYLLLIGAYRDNEVTLAHPLMLTLSDIEKTSATINTITLTALSQLEVNQLVADTLKCSEGLTWNISVLIYQKTQGNPFFVTQFLKALYQEAVIKFDFESGSWQCDIAQVTTQAVTDDVVAFMSFQLRKLTLSTQQMLELAACIGNSFDLATLAIVSQQSQLEAASALWQALQEGLILPISDIYKFYVGQEEENITDENPQFVTYKFLHDRVQQAAYSLIPDEEKQATHLKIGRLLLQDSSKEQTEERIFEIVGQLNLGQSLITDTTEKLLLAECNLKASQKALVATAYTSAFDYATRGLALLGESAWDKHYLLTLQLHNLAAEAAYLSGNIDIMEQYAQEIQQQAKSLTDTIKIAEIKLEAYTNQGQFIFAIEMALDLLSKLGIKLPQQPLPEEIPAAFEAIAKQLNGRSPSELLHLPEMTDPTVLAAMRILVKVGVASYTCNPVLFPLVALKQVELSLQYGNANTSVIGYVYYGLLLCALLEDFSTGYEFGELALQLCEKLNEKEFYGRTLVLVHFYITFCTHHAQKTLAPLQEAYNRSLEVGDLPFAGFAGFTYCLYSYFTGQPLNELLQNINIYSHGIEQIGQQTALNFIQSCQQTILNLLGQATNPVVLTGEAIDEAAMLATLQQIGDTSGLWFLLTNKIYLCFLFGEYSQTLDVAQQAKQYLGGGAATLNVPLLYFYESLALLATSGDSELIAANQEILQKRALYAPMNFQHKCDLIQAEKCRVLGQKIEAIELYDRAIAGAKENAYIQDEALANELAAKFYLDWGKQRLAQEYIIEAYYAYARWGAKAKIADLEKRYPQLLAPILQLTHSSLSTNETILALGSVTLSSSHTSSSNISDSLDLKAILKASQTLSGEIELEKLLSSLLSIVIENAGADKCVLMLSQEDSLLLQGAMTAGQEPVVLQRLPIEDSQDIPLKLIYKVKRNQQTIVLVDVTADSTLANDPYIMRQQPKSILCSPILHQGKLMGILYLENNLAMGAFTSDRVEILNLLCTQAAISLENAKLFHESQQARLDLEQKSLDLQQVLQDLQQAQLQIIQSEKMSALGNLVAGVAHEMNNPLGFIAATLHQVKPTIADLAEHIQLYQETLPNPGDQIKDHAAEIDLDYSLEDLPKMIDAMVMACNRLKNISTSLRTFSRNDRDDKVPFNLHEGIDSTILILKHRLKANEQRPAIEVATNYGNLPLVECFPGQLNQVFMNIIANAIDALDEGNIGRSFAEIQANPNQITITTSVVEQKAIVTIADNGKGMTEAVQQKIFDNLFTTKAVGKGTGLGLAIARQIVTEKHGGTLTVNSSLGQGSEFAIALSIHG
ncbi:serine/threonine protein kinase with two-component sensor domain [Nostoc carneum NIES-2107]|nr:serine/threonine protein kinase with two-component sensor domain [Nostoc carneum NIES-2107]